MFLGKFLVQSRAANIKLALIVPRKGKGGMGERSKKEKRAFCWLRQFVVLS